MRLLPKAVRLVRRGRVTRADALRAVLEHNEACIDPPLDRERLRRDFDRIERCDEDAARVGAERNTDANAGEALAPPSLSDDHLAQLLASRLREDWRHVAAWDRWQRWTGQVWKQDEGSLPLHQARLVCRTAAAGIEEADAKLARRLASKTTITSVELIARSDPLLNVSSDCWDRDLMLLNTPAGILDLATGEMRPHDRYAFMTRMAGAQPGGACRRWLTFLHEITSGDAALQAYLARLAGYALTGLTSEHVLFFLHGTGANGKSVFIDTISAVLGDYATAAPLDTFIGTFSDQHPTGLAGLRGARLVTVTETEPHRHWAVSRLKAFTSGDAMQARFMRQDFFEFRPVGKLVIAGNDKPAIGSVDEAIRRRIQLVPFTVLIPPERRDKGLSATLLQERNGILSWMLGGLADWQRTGLSPPPMVLAATNEYFAEEDLVGRWLEEECEQDKAFHETSTRLYQNWRRWTEVVGELPRTRKALSLELQKRGFLLSRIGASGDRGYRGLRLRRPGSARQGGTV